MPGSRRRKLRVRRVLGITPHLRRWSIIRLSPVRVLRNVRRHRRIRQPDLGPATIQAGGPPRRKTPSRILRRQVYARDDWRCKKCRLHSPDGRDFELHHIIEFSAGGSDEPDNLDTLCCMCHAEWTWIWTSSRAVSYERWLTLTPMILLYRTLLLAIDGVESIHDEVKRDMARLVAEMLQRSGLSRELVEQLLIRPRDIGPPTREEIDRLRGRAS